MSAFRVQRIAAILFLAGIGAHGQEGRAVRVVPERPLAGSGFSVIVELSGELAGEVEAIEPGLTGSARYIGADIMPGTPSGTMVEYHFRADGSGLVEILDLSVRVSGRVVRLGTWVVEVLSGQGSTTTRRGSWKATGSVFAREVFVIAAIDPEGDPAVCPGFAVRGAMIEPVSSIAGTFRILPLEAGSIRLPTLVLQDEAGSYTIDSRLVSVKPLPAHAAQVDAVGGPWRLGLTLGSKVSAVQPGDAIPWELKATGYGWPGGQAVPKVSLTTATGDIEAVLSGTAYAEAGNHDSSCVSGLRGVFIAGEPGEYLLAPEPYSWFDTATRTVNKAVADPLRIVVQARTEPVWNIPEDFLMLTRRMLAERADRDPLWLEVSLASDASDWAGARSTAYAVAGLDNGSGTRLALAALSALAEPGSTRVRAKSYAVFLGLERAAFPLPDVSLLRSYLEASFGNLPSAPYVLPASGLLIVIGLACMVTFLVFRFVLVVGKAGTAGIRRIFRRVSMVMAVAGVLLLVLSVASIAERSGSRFVSLGAMARTVPSVDATGLYMLETGKTGKVLESAAGWLFVEPDEGAAGWLLSGDVALY